jgi:KUP system potassium uptake protein
VNVAAGDVDAPHGGPATPGAAAAPGQGSPMWKVTLAALGVVYGDIGTSPLYALRECFHGPHAVAPTPGNVLGVLSLIVWSLVVVVSIKYLVFILRADNRGEGGILALLALVVPGPAGRGRIGTAVLVMLGLFGAALLYGDGVITPAISVLSALEGLEVATPAFQRWVLPLAVVVLVGLFAVQRRGTAHVGALFGPVTLVWFAVLAGLGAVGISRNPEVLYALGPQHAVAFFIANGAHGFVVLGAVFLAVTGGEALYADMGHFGRPAIRRAWFWLVLPALVLNYLGQGALLLGHPETKANPFYHLAPSWALYPLIALSTAATIIASQAVITGAFSLTWQAVQLGYLPRFQVQHTSEDEFGQVYLPGINTFLLVSTVAVVLAFGSSSSLAAAYGIAVTTTMVITTLLAFVVMREVWRWPLAAALALTLAFLTVDVAFLGANLAKIASGGWLPLALGVGILLVMLTWRDGRRLLASRLAERAMSFDELAEAVEKRAPARVPGTAVYLTSTLDAVPPALWRVLHHLKAMQERVILLRAESVPVPFVRPSERLEVGGTVIPGVHRVTVRYGFMEKPSIPRALRGCRAHGLPVDPAEVVYVLGRETILATERPGMAIWRERLYGFLSRNAGQATQFFRLPAERVVEVGAQIEF